MSSGSKLPFGCDDVFVVPVPAYSPREMTELTCGLANSHAIASSRVEWPRRLANSCNRPRDANFFFCQMTFSDVWEEVQPRSFWRGVPLAVLAGKKSGGQRIVRENAEAIAAAGRQDFGLDAAVKDIVWGLTTNEMGPSARYGRSTRRRRSPSQESWSSQCSAPCRRSPCRRGRAGSRVSASTGPDRASGKGRRSRSVVFAGWHRVRRSGTFRDPPLELGPSPIAPANFVPITT